VVQESILARDLRRSQLSSECASLLWPATAGILDGHIVGIAHGAASSPAGEGRARGIRRAPAALKTSVGRSAKPSENGSGPAILDTLTTRVCFLTAWFFGVRSLDEPPRGAHDRRAKKRRLAGPEDLSLAKQA
jgi:hypothetical protein